MNLSSSTFVDQDVTGLLFFFFFSYFGGEHGKTDQGGDQVPAGSHHTENGLVCARASWEL